MLICLQCETLHNVHMGTCMFFSGNPSCSKLRFKKDRFSQPCFHFLQHSLSNQRCQTAISHILHPNTLQFIPQCDTLQSSGDNTLQCHILDNISIMADGGGSEPSAAAVKMSLSTLQLLYWSSSVSGSRQLSFYWAAPVTRRGRPFFGQMCATGRRRSRAQIKEANVIFLPSTAH